MENEAFKTQAAVVRYLVERGYKTSLSTLSYHLKQGHLAKVNGLFPFDLVNRFAETYLKNAAGHRVGTSELISAKETKTRLEAEKLQEQVHMAKLQRERLQGKYISREEVYLELAARAVVLGNGLSQMIETCGFDIITLVGGDSAKYTDLIAFLQTEIDALLNTYATPDEFEVLFEEAAAGKSPTTENTGQD